jgi:multiple sugar transport system substrate-binding protein
MRSRRLTLVTAVGVSVLVAGIAAGTSHGRVDSKAGPQATALAGTVTLSGWASSPVETALLRQVIRNFERKYPRINVNYAPISGDYPAAMLAKFAARKPPDVFYVDSNVAPDWIKQRVLLDLTPFIRQYKFSTRAFYPRLLSAFQQDGKTYGLPKDWSPLGMMINTAVLQRAGVAVPKTWADLRTAARRMTAAIPEGKPICVAPDWARLLAFVYQNGGAFLNASKTRATVTSPAVRQATDFYVNLFRDGLAGTPATLGVTWCGEALGKEKAAIAFEGNWIIPYMRDTFPNVRYVTYPMIRNKQQGNLAFTVSYSIARDSKRKSLAWTLLVYLTGKQGMGVWTSKGLALPSRRDVRPVAGRAPLLAAAPYARPWQFAPGFAKVMTVAGNELTAVFEGKQDVNAMLAKIQAEAQAALRRGGR